MRQAVQVLAPTAASTSDATLVTSSASGVTIIRHIRVCNTSGSTQTFSFALGGTAATAANCIAKDQSIPANTSVDLYGPYVLPASTQVHALASAVTVTFEISGELSVAGG